jgi:hypothetical protein
MAAHAGPVARGRVVVARSRCLLASLTNNAHLPFQGSVRLSKKGKIERTFIQ